MQYKYKTKNPPNLKYTLALLQVHTYTATTNTVCKVAKVMRESVEVEVHQNTDISEFSSVIYPKRKPVVLKRIDIGDCVKKWDVNYLSAAIPQSTEVKVHVSPNKQMDFITKNFIYRTLTFQEFLKRASNSDMHENFFLSHKEKYYLRSIGENPRKDKSDISIQFPQISSDIIIPPLFEADQFFSSVFRIGSAGIQLWTHYDVMDNILIQIIGRKRVVLFDPKQLDYLYLKGDKSEVLDIDKPDFDKFPLFRYTRPLECILYPGDILFIPALWFHNVTSIDFAVSVNAFWRHLSQDYYDITDTYGNKDLKPMQSASMSIDRAIKTLQQLPSEYCDFYARSLCAKLRRQCILNS